MSIPELPGEAELPDEVELGAACDALKDVGLDHIAELLVELVRERRRRDDERRQRIHRLQRTILSGPAGPAPPAVPLPDPDDSVR
jgi:hypothetical protein